MMITEKKIELFFAKIFMEMLNTSILRCKWYANEFMEMHKTRLNCLVCHFEINQ